MTPPAPRLTGLTLADPPSLWTELGFELDGDTCVVGGVSFRLTGTGEGIVGWSFDRPVALPGAPATVAAAPGDGGPHPNGIVAVDHVVLAVDDLDAVREALTVAGIAVRREWQRRLGEREVAYLFAVVGPTVLECVGGTGAPAGPWGLTLVADDLEHAAARLGAPPGAIRDAVQPGRRILSLDTRARGGSVRLAVMDPRRRTDRGSTPP